MESLVAVTRNGRQRTSEPACFPERSKGKWRLRLMFTSRKADRPTSKHGPLCNTEQEALGGTLAFRLDLYVGETRSFVFDKRGPYLGGRIKDLTATVAANEQHIKRLQDALRTGHLPSLLLPLPPPSVEDGENAGDRTWAEDTGKPPEETVPEKQINRLWQQAYSSLEVLKEERDSDVKQLECTRKANGVLSGCKFDLLNEASLVRHEAPLLRIAAKVAGPSPQAYAPSTILRWLRDFRKEGGFRRDARGAHETDWIMSEEDLKGKLLAWMIPQPRVTVKDVCKYINGPLLQDDKEDLSRLHAYQVNLPVSMSTTHPWMIRLGCKYERATKSFYTDSHEKKEEEVDRLESLKARGPEGGFYAEVYDCKIDGQDCIAFHLDLLRDDGSVDNFDKLRAALGPEGGDCSFRFDQAAAAPVRAFHPPNKCNCGKKVHHIEEDESAYKAFLEYGKGKEGYWGYDQFEEQVEDVMDVLEHIDPDMQVVFEVDHASGHGKQREDGLYLSNMNVKYEGKQKVLRDSVMTEGCLGPEEAKMYFANGKWSTKFSEGAVQYLWERGWWKDGMSTRAGVSDEMHVEKVLQTLPDLKNERTALQYLVESRGHILLSSPKVSP
ncbi:unnamed protein product [Ectocarpus sp. CCAP 1310/34]|nr:unnamed protein product [Ectocarpus sp. CCAP 1310/34]